MKSSKVILATVASLMLLGSPVAAEEPLITDVGG